MKNYFFKVACAVILCWSINPSYAENSYVTPTYNAPSQNAVSQDVSALFDAAKNHRPDIARALIDKGADVNARDQYDMTPLMLASGPAFVNLGNEMAQMLETVNLLLDKGADVNAITNKGFTALGSAVGRGYIDVITLLLDRGANIKTKADETDDGILRRAVQFGNIDVVKLLLNKSWAQGIDQVEAKSLMWPAIGSDNSNMIKLLLARGVAIDPGYLGMAASQGRVKAIWSLLDNGAKIDEKNEQGQTPLMLAAQLKEMESIRILLQRGANVNVRNDYGQTVLEQVEARLKPRIPDYESGGENGFGKTREIIEIIKDAKNIKNKYLSRASVAPSYIPHEILADAESGVSSQQAELARRYYYGLDDISQSFSEAYYWFSICEHTTANSGIDGENDFHKKAAELQRIAMLQGTPSKKLEENAMRVLLIDPNVKKMCHVFLTTLNKKLSVTERDAMAPRIEVWKNGHPIPMEGTPLKQNQMDDLIPLAEAGDKVAQYRLGECYRSPLGCDLSEYIQHQYDHQAQQELAQQGQMTKQYSGLDLTPEYAPKAIFWLQKSADQKYGPAMRTLTMEYQRPSNAFFQKDLRKACSLMLEMFKSGDVLVYDMIANAVWNPEAGKPIEQYAWAMVAYAASNDNNKIAPAAPIGIPDENLAKSQARAQKYIQEYLRSSKPICSIDSIPQ